MKTPRFWKSRNLISTTLLPLGWIYSGLTAARLKFKKSGKVNKKGWKQTSRRLGKIV